MTSSPSSRTTRSAGLEAAVTSRHLPALDGLRAVAVATVMLYHYTESRWIPGDLGVSLFFVISGFLITLLLLREESATGTVSLRAFYFRRTLRIFPAYYVYILFSLGIDTVRGHPWSGQLLFSAFAYLVNYFNALHGHPATSVAHAWSLADEEQFYLIWPALFLLLLHVVPRRRPEWVVALAVAVLAWRSWLYLGAHVGAAYVYNAFDTRFDNLAIGCALALLASRPTALRVGTAIGRAAWMPLITLAALYASRVLLPATYHYSLGFTVDAVLMATFVVQVMQLSAGRAWGWLNHPVTRYFGALSYSLYLYHGWGMSVATHLGDHGAAFTLVAAFGAAIVLAAGSYYLVEKPFLRLKRRFEEPRSATLHALAPVPEG